MNILELSQTRFSARKYTDEPVSSDDLNLYIGVRTYGPIGCKQTALEVCRCAQQGGKREALARIRP